MRKRKAIRKRKVIRKTKVHMQETIVILSLVQTATIITEVESLNTTTRTPRKKRTHQKITTTKTRGRIKSKSKM